jgi:2,4-dienoyl-CoA reductase (NADPH2)
LDHTFDAKIASCLVNPIAAHETELLIKPGTKFLSSFLLLIASLIVSPEKKLKIAVVGAGPAGLACAVTAAGLFLLHLDHQNTFILPAPVRGHQVTLFEQNSQIGGQFNFAKVNSPFFSSHLLTAP